MYYEGFVQCERLAAFPGLRGVWRAGCVGLPRLGEAVGCPGRRCGEGLSPMHSENEDSRKPEISLILSHPMSDLRHSQELVSFSLIPCGSRLGLWVSWFCTVKTNFILVVGCGYLVLGKLDPDIRPLV